MVLYFGPETLPPDESLGNSLVSQARPTSARNLVVILLIAFHPSSTADDGGTPGYAHPQLSCGNGSGL